MPNRCYRREILFLPANAREAAFHDTISTAALPDTRHFYRIGGPRHGITLNDLALPPVSACANLRNQLPVCCHNPKACIVILGRGIVGRGTITVSRFLAGIAKKGGAVLRAEWVDVNGEAGVRSLHGDRVVTILVAQTDESGRVDLVLMMRNPEKPIQAL